MDATHLKSTVYYQDPSSGHWYNEVDVRFDGTDTTGWRCIDASKQKPLERPEYVRCISHNRVGSYQSTWCGRINQPGDSVFLNLTHAANNGLSPAGRLVACKECAEAAYTALAHGHPYDSRAPDLPTTSAVRELAHRHTVLFFGIPVVHLRNLATGILERWGGRGHRGFEASLPNHDECALAELIGEYSQTILDCSYNSEDILEMLINRTLDKQAAYCRAHDPAFARKLGSDFLEDGRYEDRLLDLVLKAGGWPLNYQAPVILLQHCPEALRNRVTEHSLRKKV